MRGKSVKLIRRLAAQFAVSKNDTTSVTQSFRNSDLTMQIRVLKKNSQKFLERQIRNLWNQYPHHFRRLMLEELEFDANGFLQKPT